MKTRLLFLCAIVIMISPTLVPGQGISTISSYRMAAGMLEKLPMISTKWSQGCLYNAVCPNDTASHVTCLHVPAGPGAIAMAQIMKFYQFPAHGTGEHGYPLPKYGIQYANFGATNYEWSGMPDSLTAGSDGLATLVYQCGVAQNMNYGTGGSYSVYEAVDSAFVKYFSYPANATWKSKSAYSTADWIAMLKSELDASHPLLYAGYNANASLQTFFICDGYQNDTLFHFNFGGAGGLTDGYYSINHLLFDTQGLLFAQQALFGLAPSKPGPVSYVMDFENVPDFSLTFNNWTVNDVDKHDTYSIPGHSFPHQAAPMAFLSFNPAQVTPSMASVQTIQPHSGQRFGACFSSNPPANNDWFISPRIQLGVNGSFSFWVKSYTDTYGLDNYTVAVSVTDSLPASFTVISGSQALQTTLAWTKKTFNLSNFNNQKVYVAINCVSNDHILMMIDDLEVKPQAPSTLSADFTSDKMSLRIGDTVNFTDQSSGMPVTWNWKFPGGTPSGSSLQNPSGIRYLAAGTFPVSLKVSNGSAGDSITKTGYITVNGYATYMSLDFETVDDFSLTFNPWSVIDVNGGNTYGIQSVVFPHNYQPMSYICFNPSQTTPPMENMTAHSGQKLGCCFSSTPPMNPNNKWLISPKMSLGLTPQIGFWVKTYNTQFGEERYNVAVSTKDQSPASFVSLKTTPESAPADWTMKTYSLSDYTNQDVYIAIQCVTNDGFIFMLDDISITSSLGVGETNLLNRLVVFPNPAKDILILNCPATLQAPLVIELISSVGNTISTWREIPVSGKIMLDIQKIPQGLYILRVSSGADAVIRKVSIINQ